MSNSKTIFMSSIISVIAMFITLFIMFNIPTITLNGDDFLKIEVHSNYKEEGAVAKAFINDKTDDIEIINNINIDEVGIYEVLYKFGSVVEKRVVEVVDNTKPLLTLNGKEEALVCPNKEYIEEGYVALDNYDGDITDKVIIKEIEEEGNRYLEYEVNDSSSNRVSVRRKIIVCDNEKPIINLNGSKVMTLLVNTSYYEAGYSAFDNCDEDITNRVVVSNNIDITKTGIYHVTYTVSDSSNNTFEITRTVNVINPIYGSNIFLTFDDGPSHDITPRILDILKAENVKATFFIIDFDQSKNYLLERMVNEGHTIAIHGYSHNYYEIYKSVDAYMYNLDTLRTKIKNVTGIDTNITRFPGGSSNTVSRFNPGIMTTLSREVVNRGYLYYDWNVDSNDAGSARTSSDVYNNVTRNLVYGRNNIVLMHDFSGNYITLNALSDIIRYGKNSGYNFLPLSSDVPMVMHAVNN